MRWFEHWTPELDEALQALPEMDCCPHLLYRSLMQAAGTRRKRAALVTEAGAPVALPIVKNKGRFSWEPVTQWLAPRAVFPCRPGYIVPTLEALGIDIWVGWWRWEGPPPRSPLMRSLEPTPTHGLNLTDDYEQYWRESSHFKAIRKARNHCKGLLLSVNAAGAAEWTIRNWASRWGVDSTEVADRILVAGFLEERGRHHSLLLLDGNEPVAGATQMADGHDVIAGVLYRRPEYDRYGAGVRLIDLVFHWAAESGFQRFDLGGGHQYKHGWAPQTGERWLFNVCPTPLFRAKQVGQAAQRVYGRARDLVHRRVPTDAGPGVAPDPR